MGGFDDHVGINGDWMLPSPSPRSLFSAMMGGDTGSWSASECPKNDNNSFTFPGPDGQKRSENGDESERGPGVDQETKTGAFDERKTSSRAGLVERMAARAGFNAPRLNTDIIRPAADVSQNQGMRSPYLTIPPGLSPTTLLDSPVFLSNSLVQPSPTTGKFQFASIGNDNNRNSIMSVDSNRSKDKFSEDANSSSFAFKPVPESAALSCGPVNPPFMSWQPFPSIEAQVQSKNQPHLQSTVIGTSLHLHSDFSMASTETKAEVNNLSSKSMPFGAVNDNKELSQENLEEHNNNDDDDADQRISAPSEDGYNWRKYGQKQVKGSEYPRSYYKCTHPNCPVKKKVERSHEGHITEIIYKGAHNHPKPLSNRRSGLGSSSGLCDMGELGGAAIDGNFEETSSSAMVLHGQTSAQFESSDALDNSSTFTNDEEEDDRATHGSVSLGCDGEEDESESKRRKVEAYAADVSGASRAIREPRVVVQTTSEVDILDDGYRWRKYGQKVVKGNPNPRSYYKCTSTGCTVRKHVERASHDLKSVITTYEGKHNHDVPVARNNTMASQAQSLHSQVHRPEPSQVQNTMARFERPHYGLPGAPHGYGYPMSQPGPGGAAHMAMARLGPNQYLGQPRQMSEMGFVLPKGEPKVEPMSDPGLNLANGSSVYHQIMNRLPLGP